MHTRKTRVAYAIPKDKSTGKYPLCDTVEEALKSNMLVRDYEEQLIKSNPQLDITIVIERVKME